MSWRIDEHPEGGLQISHLVAPRFTARWTTGDFPIDHIKEGAFFWTDQGSGEDDAIHVFAFVWTDRPEKGATLERLIWDAVMEIEKYIAR